MILKKLILHGIFLLTIFPLYGQYSQLEKYLPDLDSKNNDVQIENNVKSNSASYSLNEIVLENSIDPLTYIVGPGDVFSFNMISSDGHVTLPLTISPLGEILIPLIGTIDLRHLTLTEAMIKIKNFCKNKYKNSQINITLSHIRKFKVKVIGMHEKVGYFVVTPVTRLSELYTQVIKVDDFNESRYTMRNVKLIRNGQVKFFDIKRSLVLGEVENNPFLNNGDIINIGIINNFVDISGGVVRPGKYEYVQGELISDLIKLSGGFAVNADSTKIEITRFINDVDKKNIKLNSLNEFKKFKVNAEDHILVRIKKEYKRQTTVTINGEVKYPGKYSIDDQVKTIKDLINIAGGYTNRADQNRLIFNNKEIYQQVDKEFERIQMIPIIDQSDSERGYIKARNRALKGKVESYSEQFTSELLNYTLSRNDEVIIPEKFEFVELLGAIMHPGRIPLIPNYSIDDYIKISGGLSDSATKDKYVIKASSGQHIKFQNVKILESGDIIFISEKIEYNKWTRFKEVMAITGQTAAIIAVIQNALSK